MKNKYEVRGDVTAIFMKKKDGTVLETLIDTDDFHIADSFPNTWFDHRGYVTGWTDQGSPTKPRLGWFLHRLILNAPSDKLVDHININPSDNRRKNLRIADISQNNQNLKNERKNNKSGIRGVWWDKDTHKWHAGIQFNYKRICVGYFSDLEDAEKAIKEARAKYMPFSSEVTEGIVPSGFIESAREKEFSRGNKNNKSSGLSGVCWSKKANKWQVNVMVDSKIKYFYYNDLNDAKNKAFELRKQRDTLS